MKKKLWITYAWVDNEEHDFDYLVQQLDPHLDVRFDRRKLIPGQRLWEQIAEFITDPSQCDAWAWLITRNSIASEACQEELFYALNRAINGRGKKFPIIGLLHNISADALPPALAIRLCISMDSPNWINEVLAGVEMTEPAIPKEFHAPLAIRVHNFPKCVWIEIAARFESISPFMIAVPLSEKKDQNIQIFHIGPSNSPPQGSFGGMAIGPKYGESEIDGHKVYFWSALNEVSPRQSYYLCCKQKPSVIYAGNPSKNGIIQFT
jgi:hypothetical protein